MSAERLYGWLLHLYPREFRERFGNDMRELFRDRRRALIRRHDGSRPTVAMRVLFWIRTFADIARHASAERKDRLMLSLTADLRYATRTLLRQPAFTLIAILTLALGIGANATIFSIVNAVLFRPLPYPNADRLVFLQDTTSTGARDYVSYLNLEDWLARGHTLEHAAVFRGQTVNLTGGEEPDRLLGAFVSTGFFEMIDARPYVGRLFTPTDDQDGAERVVVLQYTTWQHRFAGRGDIIDQTLILNNQPHRVIGILPPKFDVPLDDQEIWLPARSLSDVLHTRRDARSFTGVGKLRAGVTIEQSRADLAGVAATLAREYPTENAGRGVAVDGLQNLLVSDTRAALLVLFAAVGCVLLIACVNLANLVLARGVGRARELSVRAALGASRGRLLMLLLLESLLLACAGGAAGLALAYGGVTMVLPFVPEMIPRRNEISIDAQVLLFTCAVSLATGLLCGLMPGLRLSRVDLNDALRSGGGARGGTEKRETAWTRHALVVCDIALSLTLLVGAGLLTRTLVSLIAESPGFRPDHLLSLEYRLPRNKYGEPTSQWTFHQRVVERVRQVPGVTDAALVRSLAFSGNGASIGFALPGERMPTDTARLRQAMLNTITPEYFHTMGIPLFAGRTCGAQDTDTSPAVIIVNRYLAQQMWPNESPIGKQLVVADNTKLTVIGLSGSTKQWSLAEPERPQIYNCYSQQPDIFATLVVRTSVEPLTLTKAVQAAIWSVDKDQPMWKIRTADWLVDRAIAPAQFVMELMLGAAGLALLLALVGIYGVMSYNVNRQTREIGVRLALGAEPRDIVRLVLGRGFWLTVAGIVLGLAGARWMASLLGELLFGVTSTDVVTYAAVALLLAAVSLLACYIPARRAMRVNPITALHAE